MKFLKRIRIFVIYSLILSILYIPNTGYAAWSGSAYSPGETLNPECAPSDSGCTVSLSFTASNGNIGIGSTTPWGKLSVNPNGISGPAFVIGSSTATSFVVTNGGMVGIGTTSPWAQLSINPNGITGPAFAIGSSTKTDFVVTNGGRVGIGTTSPFAKFAIRSDGTTTGRAFVVTDSTNIERLKVLDSGTIHAYGDIQTDDDSTDTYFGVGAGDSAVLDGGSNTAIGYSSFYSNTGSGNGYGYDNTAVGAQALYSMNGISGGDAYGNVALGRRAMWKNVLGAENVAIGYNAFDNLTAGNGNVAIGPNIALNQTSGSNNIIIGNFINVPNLTGSNQLNIGNLIFGTNIGTGSDISTGNIGIATTSPSSILSIKQSSNTSSNGIWQSGTDGDFRSIYMSDTSGTLSFFGGDTAGALNTATLSSAGTWTNASDRSYKENIANLDTKYNLNTLLSIQPRFYTMKGSGKPQIGFIAQELQPILPEVVEGTEGSLGISYGNMVALLVQAIKDINTKVDNLATTVSDKVKIMFGEKVETKRLCLEGLCITRDELQRILYTTNVNGIYEQTIPSSTNNQQNNNSNNSSNNSTNQNTSNNNVGTSTEQTNNSTTTPQSNINPDAGSNNTKNIETNTQTNTQSDNTQGSTTPATIPETPPETPIEQPVPPQTPDISSTTPNTLPEPAN